MLCRSFDYVRKALHSSSIPIWDTFSFEGASRDFHTIEIYTDASGGAEQGDLAGPPAWALAVFGLKGSEARHFLGHLGATIPELAGHPLKSACAEFTAAQWAALWLLQAPLDVNISIDIFSDNMDVVTTSQGGTVDYPLVQERSLLDSLSKVLASKV